MEEYRLQYPEAVAAATAVTAAAAAAKRIKAAEGAHGVKKSHGKEKKRKSEGAASKERGSDSGDEEDVDGGGDDNCDEGEVDGALPSSSRRRAALAAGSKIKRSALSDMQPLHITAASVTAASAASTSSATNATLNKNKISRKVTAKGMLPRSPGLCGTAKGIKQTDLDEDADLLNSDLVRWRRAFSPSKTTLFKLFF